MRAGAYVSALAFAFVACDSNNAVQRKFMEAANIANPDTMGAIPTTSKRIPVHARRSLKEASAAVITGAQPAIVFTINDSGNDPELFAIDTTGESRGVWRVNGATNYDWESLSPGPCATTATLPNANGAAGIAGRQCLYIGDAGDNSAVRATVMLYRVPEPPASKDDRDGVLVAERLIVRYPDRAHDVEAMFTTSGGDTYLITKRALKSPSGALRPSLVFLVPFTAWGTAEPVTATLVDSLPIVPGSSQLRQITDASLSHDEQYLAVRTYGQVYVFAFDHGAGRVNHQIPPALCNIQFVERQHGEGVSWFGETRDLLLDSEGWEQPFHRIACPLPHAPTPLH